MKKFIFTSLVIAGFSVACQAATALPVLNQVSVIASTRPAAGTAGSITISSTVAGPYSSGTYTFLTNLYIQAYSTMTIAATGVISSCTLSGIPTAPPILFQTNQATGTLQTASISFGASPAASTQATAVVLACPAVTGIVWNMILTYFQY